MTYRSLLTKKTSRQRRRATIGWRATFGSHQKTLQISLVCPSRYGPCPLVFLVLEKAACFAGGLLLIAFLAFISATAAFSQNQPQVLLYNADNNFKEFKVLADGAQQPVATGSVHYWDSRTDVPANLLELLNLPADWRKIEAFGPEKTPLPAIIREQSPTPPPEGVKNQFWFLRHPWLSFFFILLGFYAVFAIGLSGGPNHGEHPFILNVCHLVGFLFLAKAWNPNYYYAYLTVLALALSLSMYATRIRVWDQPIQSWIFKGLMIGCYVTLFLILTNKTYTSYAIWSSTGSIQFYVPRQDRGSVQVLGEREKVLAEFSLTSAIDCRNLLFWSEKEKPQTLKIVSPRRGNFVLALPEPNSKNKDGE